MNPDPAHIDSMSWAAGVLDAIGRFRFRLRDEYPYATMVWVRCEQALGERLTEIFKVGKWKEGKWTVTTFEQERFLSVVIPYLRVKHLEAGKVYKWRLTAPRRRIGWRVTTAVGEFRESLVEDVDESGRRR